MYDYGLSILEQYGLNAESSARTRGALLCRTEKGLVIIREFGGTEKKLQKQQELLEKLSEQECLVDCYISNQEGALVAKDRDGIPYTIQQWYVDGSVIHVPEKIFFAVFVCLRRFMRKCRCPW